MTKNKKILITGGAGSIGSELVRQLAPSNKIFILDNNETVICTPEHKFMLRDSSFVQAQDLKPEMSLMPLRKKYPR